MRQRSNILVISLVAFSLLFSIVEKAQPPNPPHSLAVQPAISGEEARIVCQQYGYSSQQIRSFQRTDDLIRTAVMLMEEYPKFARIVENFRTKDLEGATHDHTSPSIEKNHR